MTLQSMNTRRAGSKPPKYHVLSVLVENRAGVLARSLARDVSMLVQLYEESDKGEAAVMRIESMANERLSVGLEGDLQPDAEMISSSQKDRRVVKNTIENYFPCNPGNAVRIQL